MKLRTVTVAGFLSALCLVTIAGMYWTRDSPMPPPVSSALTGEAPVFGESVETQPDEEAVGEVSPVEPASVDVPPEGNRVPEETDPGYSTESASSSEATAVGGFTERELFSVQGQVSEEEIARAFDMLGQVLGLSEMSPEELKRKVEEVGKLRFRRDVPIDFMSREELSKYLHDLFEQEYPPEVAEREERALRGLGFLRPGEDLRSIRARVLNENIAGFYDERPRVRKLFAVSSSSGRNLGLMNQLILSHELRHALQDQYLDLGRILGTLSDYDDRKLAALSLIEGDATLLMERYMTSAESIEGTGLEGLLGGFGAGAMDSRSLAEMFAGPELRSAPPVVREQLMAPYIDGRMLAGIIHEKGGFRSLNERLQELPRSMEQVLHPEKYLERVDEPVEMTPTAAGGNGVESEGRIGELFVRCLFEGVLPADEGAEAAAGWGGDGYVLWVDGEGRNHVLWRTIWDTDGDASEFFDALARFSSIRFGGGPTPALDSDVVESKGPDGSTSRVSRRGREVVLEREGFR